MPATQTIGWNEERIDPQEATLTGFRLDASIAELLYRSHTGGKFVAIFGSCLEKTNCDIRFFEFLDYSNLVAMMIRLRVA